MCANSFQGQDDELKRTISNQKKMRFGYSRLNACYRRRPRTWKNQQSHNRLNIHPIRWLVCTPPYMYDTTTIMNAKSFSGKWDICGNGVFGQLDGAIAWLFITFDTYFKLGWYGLDFVFSPDAHGFHGLPRYFHHMANNLEILRNSWDSSKEFIVWNR